MIDLTPYTGLMDDLDRGETLAVCHDDCDAGADTRYRLYLTRTASSPNVVLGYCHNCSDSGVHREVGQAHAYRNFTGHTKHTSVGTPFAVPNHMVQLPRFWPDDATAWRIQKKLSNEQCVRYGIEYDPNTHRVYLPIYDTIIDGTKCKLIGYQLRQIDGTGPKYLTAQYDQDIVLSTMLRYTTDLPKYWVLVEDLASGIAVHEATNATNRHPRQDVGVLVNYGIKTKVEALGDTCGMAMGYVWLDNDSAFVKDRAIQISQTWRLITGVPVSRNTFDSDPKNRTGGEIRKILREGGIWSIA